MGYARDEVKYYDIEGASKPPMIWLSSNVNNIPVSGTYSGTLIAVLIRYIPGAEGAIQNFHVMRRNHVDNWSEKGGPLPVKLLTVNQMKANVAAYKQSGYTFKGLHALLINF